MEVEVCCDEVYNPFEKSNLINEEISTENGNKNLKKEEADDFYDPDKNISENNVDEMKMYETNAICEI